MCVKETLAQAIIGKAPRLEIHTLSYPLNVQAVVDTTRKGLLVDCITTVEKTWRTHKLRELNTLTKDCWFKELGRMRMSFLGSRVYVSFGMRSTKTRLTLVILIGHTSYTETMYVKRTFWLQDINLKGGYQDSARLLGKLCCQITWWIVLTKKIDRPLGKNILRKSRNSRGVSGGGVGAEVMVKRA